MSTDNANAADANQPDLPPGAIRSINAAKRRNEIIRLRNAKVPVAEIAREFGITTVRVYQITKLGR